MSDEPITPPAPKLTRHDQDQDMANHITAACQALTVAQSDAELAPLLAARGYDATKLAQGLALQQAAQNAFTARQQAIAQRKQATAASEQAEANARQAYADFRQTARSIFKDDAARAALELSGVVSRDLQIFITTARASYDAALATPDYLAELTQYGYPQATIQSALALLHTLVTMDDAQESAKSAATRATALRDQALDTLDEWLSQFRGIAQVATRGRPDLAKKIQF